MKEFPKDTQPGGIQAMTQTHFGVIIQSPMFLHYKLLLGLNQMMITKYLTGHLLQHRCFVNI